MDAWQIVISILGSSALTAAVVALIQRKKTNAETDSIVVKVANEVVEMLRAELNILRKKITDCEEDRTTLHVEVRKLKRAVGTYEDEPLAGEND